MDPNPNSYPILSYVMARLPTFGSKPDPNTPDIEQPPSPPPGSPSDAIMATMPRLSDPKLLAAMTQAVSDVAQTRRVLQTIGDRPDHEAVDAARARVADIEASLAREAEEGDRSAAEREREICRAVVRLEETHEAYERLLREAEERLERIYHEASDAAAPADAAEEGEEPAMAAEEEVDEEVVGILREASDGGGMERVSLSGRKLRILPEAFGRIRGLTALDVSSNQLEAIPDAIAGLENLEELNASSNLLLSLPDSIGLLQKLRILNVSANKLNNLPDPISHCRSLVELDVSFNSITYLPTNIGYELGNLEKLQIQLNKIRSLPSSVCEMRSLRYLDARFNQLRGLPLAIGKLPKLEVVNLSSNFSDLTELPDTFGDLTNLKELDLSNNQIHALPDTFGRLENLTKLNLDQNPLLIPPPEVVREGVEAVQVFMAKRWVEILLEEEKRCMLEVQEQAQAGWLTRSTSWVKSYVSGVSEYLASPKGPRDSYLDQQL